MTAILQAYSESGIPLYPYSQDNNNVNPDIQDATGDQTLSIGVMKGGGSWGLVSTYLAEYFENQSGRPFHENFDQIEAVSVGTIQAGALWPLECSGRSILNTSELKYFFLNESDGRFGRNLLSLGGLVGSKYDLTSLEEIIDEIFGEVRLSDYEDGLHIYVVDLETQNLLKLTSQEAKADPGKDYYMKDLIRTAISAPYYFDPVEIQNLAGETKHFIDAGVWSSNPAFKAYFDAVTDGVKPENMAITVFGTGHRAGEPVTIKDLDGGASEIGNTIKIMFNSSSNTYDDMLQERLKMRYNVLDTDITGADIDMVTNDIAQIIPYAEKAVSENADAMAMATNLISGLKKTGPVLTTVDFNHTARRLVMPDGSDAETTLKRCITPPEPEFVKRLRQNPALAV